MQPEQAPPGVFRQALAPPAAPHLHQRVATLVPASADAAGAQGNAAKRPAP